MKEELLAVSRANVWLSGFWQSQFPGRFISLSVVKSTQKLPLAVDSSWTVGDALMQLPRHCRVSCSYTARRAHDAALISRGCRRVHVHRATADWRELTPGYLGINCRATCFAFSFLFFLPTAHSLTWFSTLSFDKVGSTCRSPALSDSKPQEIGKTVKFRYYHYYFTAWGGTLLFGLSFPPCQFSTNVRIAMQIWNKSYGTLKCSLMAFLKTE